MILGRGPNDQLLWVASQRGSRLGERGTQHQGCTCRSGAFDRVNDYLGFRIRRALDVDFLQNDGDGFVVRGRGEGREALGIGRVGRESSVGNGRAENLRGAGRGDRLESVNHRLGRLLGGRFLSQLLDQGGYLFVDLGRGPGEQLGRLGTQREAGIGHRPGQELNGVNRARAAHAFQCVDSDLLGVFALDVDLLQRYDHRLVTGGSCPDYELIGIGALRRLGIRNGHPQKLHRTCGGDRLQRVDHHRSGRRGRFGSRGHFVDQFLDLLVILGRGPDDQLLWVVTQRRSRLGERGPQHQGCTRRGSALDRVNDYFGFRIGRALDVDLLQNGGDSLVVRGGGEDRETLRVARVRR